MVAALVFLVAQLFLFGTTSAQCGVACTLCKVIPGGDYEGTWNLKAEIDPRCPGRCLYQRISDGNETCFCDPGPIEYDDTCYDDAVKSTTQITPWGGLCYKDQEPKLYDHSTELSDNSVENCRAYCSGQNNNYTYIGLEANEVDFQGTICYCGNIEPPTKDHPLKSQQDDCFAACPGNKLEKCGGVDNINVWAV